MNVSPALPGYHSNRVYKLIFLLMMLCSIRYMELRHFCLSIICKLLALPILFGLVPVTQLLVPIVRGKIRGGIDVRDKCYQKISIF